MTVLVDLNEIAVSTSGQRLITREGHKKYEGPLDYSNAFEIWLSGVFLQYLDTCLESVQLSFHKSFKAALLIKPCSLSSELVQLYLVGL